MSNSSLQNNDISKDYHKLEIGAVLFFLLSLVLACYAAWALHKLKRPHGRTSYNVSGGLGAQVETVIRAAIRLMYAVVAAIPFIIVRAVYSLVYAFGHNPKVGPTTGGFGVKLILVFLIPLVAVLALITGGLITINMTREVKKLKGMRNGDATPPPPPGLETESEVPSAWSTKHGVGSALLGQPARKHAAGYEMS